MALKAFSEEWAQAYKDEINRSEAYKNAEEPEWAYFPNLHDTDDDGQGAIELECDDFASPGWSGGPIYGPVNNQWTVIGVDSDSESEYIFPASVEHDSVFAGGSWMVGLIQYGLANWPPS